MLCCNGVNQSPYIIPTTPKKYLSRWCFANSWLLTVVSCFFFSTWNSVMIDRLSSLESLFDSKPGFTSISILEDRVNLGYLIPIIHEPIPRPCSMSQSCKKYHWNLGWLHGYRSSGLRWSSRTRTGWKKPTARMFSKKKSLVDRFDINPESNLCNIHISSWCFFLRPFEKKHESNWITYQILGVNVNKDFQNHHLDIHWYSSYSSNCIPFSFFVWSRTLNVHHKNDEWIL